MGRDRDVLAILGQGLLVVMLLGAYREGGQLGDLWVMVVLGVIGFFLNATGVPHAPWTSTTVPPRRQSIAERQQRCRVVPAPAVYARSRRAEVIHDPDLDSLWRDPE